MNRPNDLVGMGPLTGADFQAWVKRNALTRAAAGKVIGKTPKTVRRWCAPDRSRWRLPEPIEKAVVANWTVPTEGEDE